MNFVVYELCRLSSQIWGLVLRGDAKTLTPNPWTPRADLVHRPLYGPVHGPPKKDNNKNDN